jgi:hypothetical protein
MTTTEIEFEGYGSLVLFSPVLLTNEQVRSYVGTCWTLPDRWVNVIDDVEVSKPNPFQRRDGMWVWLLRKENDENK